jgi:hypothetical protein
MFAEVDRQKMPAIAMTDHGNMHGAYDFHKRATEVGVTPVIGIEAYVAPESRFHKKRVQWGEPSQKRDDLSGGGLYTHKTIWARNKTGLHNLFRLTSRAYTDGFVFKYARMDTELITRLMATTGCPSGEVQTRLRLGHFDKALEAAARYQDIFGRENDFPEIMDHRLDIERRVRDGLVEISEPQHPARRRAGRRERHVRVPQPHAEVRHPRGRDRGELVPQGGPARHASPTSSEIGCGTPRPGRCCPVRALPASIVRCLGSRVARVRAGSERSTVDRTTGTRRR